MCGSCKSLRGAERRRAKPRLPVPLDEDIAEAAEAREGFALTEGQAAALCVRRCVH